MPITSVLSSQAGIGQFAPTVATFNEEYDEKIRDCEVLIYLTPLPVAILKDLDWNSVKHWALVFKYDNRTILFELVNLTGSMVGGLIKPSWRDFDENNVSIFSNEVSLGTIKTSPREVYLAGKSSLILANLCILEVSDWLVDLAEQPIRVDNSVF